MSDDEAPAGFEPPTVTATQQVLFACVPVAVGACVFGL